MAVTGTDYMYPQARTCPGGAGGSACQANSNQTDDCYGHAKCDAGTDKESCDHKSFNTGSNDDFWTSATLKVGWRIENQGTSHKNCAADWVKLRYSLNNGSSWSDLSGFPKAGTTSVQSGTVTLALSTSQNMGNVRVRNNTYVTGPVCPTGACCYGANFCNCRIDDFLSCDESGGSYQGDGVSCSGECDWAACGGSGEPPDNPPPL